MFRNTLMWKYLAADGEGLEWICASDARFGVEFNILHKHVVDLALYGRHFNHEHPFLFRRQTLH